MAAVTGDLQGKVGLIQRDLKQIKYPVTLNSDRLASANPRDLIAILSFVLQQFSSQVASLAAEYLSQGHRHSKFLDGAFRLARDKFGLRISLSTSQFLSEGYAERKLMLVHQFIQACQEYHSTASRQQRLASLKSANAQRRLLQAAPNKHHHKEQKDKAVQNMKGKIDAEDQEYVTYRHVKPAYMFDIKENAFHPDGLSVPTTTTTPMTTRQGQGQHPSFHLGQHPHDNTRSLHCSDSGDALRMNENESDGPRQIPAAILGYCVPSTDEPAVLLNLAQLTELASALAAQKDCLDNTSTGPTDQFGPHESAIATDLPDVRRLSSIVDRLQVRLEKTEETLASLRQNVGMLETNTLAHFSVLETRVASLERQRPFLRPVPSHLKHPSEAAVVAVAPPAPVDTDFDASAKHSLADNKIVLYPPSLLKSTAISDEKMPPIAGAAGESSVCCYYDSQIGSRLGRQQQQQGGDVVYSRSEQGWVRWNSPTACFNPLFNSQNSQVWRSVGAVPGQQPKSVDSPNPGTAASGGKIDNNNALSRAIVTNLDSKCGTNCNNKVAAVAAAISPSVHVTRSSPIKTIGATESRWKDEASGGNIIESMQNTCDAAEALLAVVQGSI